jgi:hypothetical protein
MIEKSYDLVPKLKLPREVGTLLVRSKDFLEKGKP